MSRRLLLALSCAGCALVGAACGEEDTDARTPARVALTMTASDGSARTATAKLECRGSDVARGTSWARRSARARCRAARSLAAFIDTQPPPDRACTQIYGGPETVRIRGTIGKRRVDRKFARTDGCEISDFQRLTALITGSPAAR